MKKQHKQKSSDNIFHSLKIERKLSIRVWKHVWQYSTYWP